MPNGVSAAIGFSNLIGDGTGTVMASLAVGSSNVIKDTTGVAAFNTALGTYNFISGDNSTAMGQINFVYGTNSMAAGDWTSVDGTKTIALGSHLVTESIEIRLAGIVGFRPQHRNELVAGHKNDHAIAVPGAHA